MKALLLAILLSMSAPLNAEHAFQWALLASDSLNLFIVFENAKATFDAPLIHFDSENISLFTPSGLETTPQIVPLPPAILLLGSAALGVMLFQRQA